MPALPLRCPPGSLDPSSGPEVGRVVAEGRLVDAVADGTVLRGTPATLARQLGISAGDLLAAIEELTAVGWVMLEVGSQGELSARWMDDLPPNRSAQRRGGPVGRRALTGGLRTSEPRPFADGDGRPTHAVRSNPPRSRPASTRPRLARTIHAAAAHRRVATIGTSGAECRRGGIVADWT